MLVKVGTYTGDGNDNRVVSGLGFTPDLVMIKQNGSEGVVWRTSVMGAGDSYTPSIGVGALSDGIKSFGSGQFTLGTSSRVNTNGTAYYYIAIADNGEGDFKVGSYSGNGSSQSITGIGFNPDMVIVRSASTPEGIFKTSAHSGANSSILYPATNTTAGITALITDGFSVGSLTYVNTNSATYFYAAFKSDSSKAMAIGSYTGNATDNRDITIASGFAPKFVTIKSQDGNGPVIRTSDYSGDDTGLWHAAANAANRIQQFNSDGFQLGTSSFINGSGVVSIYFAFRDRTHDEADRNLEITGKSSANADRDVEMTGEADSQYSKENTNTLPSDNAVLADMLTVPEIEDIATDDEEYSTIEGINSYNIFNFTESVSDPELNLVGHWQGQSQKAPSSSAVYLQVYNLDTDSWETIDSDNSSSANTDFDLEGVINSNQADYIDGSNLIYFRVYQEL